MLLTLCPFSVLQVRNCMQITDFVQFLDFSTEDGHKELTFSIC